MKIFPNVLITVALVLVAACGPSARQRFAAQLDEVETFINDRPDSALAVLRALDADSLRGPSQRARAALLHQVALDKCYIDITSDSVLSPAFWYLRHGSADQKLKTWYYRSVLSRNAGDVDTQMSCLIRAEQYIPKAEDPLMAGFVYTAKRVVFLHIYDLDDAALNAERAVEAYRQIGDGRRHTDAVISLANLFNLQERYEESGRLLDTLFSCWGSLSPRQQRLASGVRFKQLVETGRGSQIAPLMEQYLQSAPESEIDWVLVARADLVCGDARRAELSLAHTRREALNKDELFTYLKVYADVLRALGRETEAMEMSEEYRKLLDASVEKALSSRAKYLVEERSLQLAKTSRGWWITGLTLLALLLCGWMWRERRELTRHRLNADSLQRSSADLREQLAGKSKQLRFLARENREVREEVGRLEALLQQNAFPESIRSLISDRVAMLNEYGVRVLSGKETLASMKLQERLQLNDRAQFLRMLYEQFRYLNPQLNASFEQRRLTEQEVICSVLLGFGLSVEEVAGFMNLSAKRCYNIFNAVRFKMGWKGDKRTLQTILAEQISAQTEK